MTHPTAKKIASRYIEADWELYAMTNMRSPSTGVEGAVLWAFVGEYEGKKLPHGPRVKVIRKGEPSVSVTIEKKPRVLGKLPTKLQKQVVQFIELNREALLAHWRDEIDSVDLVQQIKKV